MIYLLLIALAILFIIYEMSASMIRCHTQTNAIKETSTKSTQMVTTSTNSQPNETKNVNSSDPILTYVLSGGFAGYGLKLNIYESGNYTLLDKGNLKVKGQLNEHQMKVVRNIVGTIDGIREKDEPINGNDILYKTLTTQKNSTSMDIYEKYKTNDEEIKLLNQLMDRK